MRSITALSFLLLTAGCASASATPAFEPATSTSVSSTATLQSTGATLVYPAGGGYTASMIYSANNAPAGTTVTVTTITNPPESLAPMDPPPGRALIAYEITATQNVTFSVWNGFITSISLPPSIDPNGHTFSDYGYDLTLGIASGSDPGTVSGSTISFPTGRPPSHFLANHTYLMIVAMQ